MSATGDTSLLSDFRSKQMTYIWSWWVPKTCRIASCQLCTSNITSKPIYCCRNTTRTAGLETCFGSLRPIVGSLVDPLELAGFEALLSRVLSPRSELRIYSP